MSIVQHHDTLPATPAPGSTGANLIREAAAVMVDAHKLATAVASTQMIPKHFHNKPDELAAAMLYGASLNLDPMQSARQIYVIHGQAALYARAMVALVLGAGHKVWTVDSTDQAVTVAAQRKNSEHVEQTTWTFDRAKKAGYTNNDKYRTDPQAMLYSKAASEVCRKVAPDVLSGVYAVEELEMERWDQPATTVQQVPTTSAERLRGVLAAPQADEPGTDAPPVPTELDAEPPESPLLNVRSNLAKAMYAAFNESSVEEAERIVWISNVIERDITSTKEMTEDEARVVLDHLGQQNPEVAS